MGNFSSFFKLSLALLHGVARYYFSSFFSALTRSNSRIVQYCSGRLLSLSVSLALAMPATLFCDFLASSFPVTGNFATDSSLSLSASVKPSHENITNFAIVVGTTM